MLPSNSRHSQIVATLSCKFGNSEQMKSHAPSNSSHDTRTCVQIISDDGHQACARAVGVLRLDTMADSRTERLCELLSVSNSRHCITRTYLIQPSLTSAGFPQQ